MNEFKDSEEEKNSTPNGMGAWLLGHFTIILQYSWIRFKTNTNYPKQ